MTWELIWMLVILKIPVVYLGLVVWWAVKAKPPLEPALRAVASDIDLRPAWRFLRPHPRRPRRGPHGTPGRGYRRQVVRARVGQ